MKRFFNLLIVLLLLATIFPFSDSYLTARAQSPEQTPTPTPTDAIESNPSINPPRDYGDQCFELNRLGGKVCLNDPNARDTNPPYCIKESRVDGIMSPICPDTEGCYVYNSSLFGEKKICPIPPPTIDPSRVPPVTNPNWKPLPVTFENGGPPCRKAYWSTEVFCADIHDLCFHDYRQSLVSPKNDICPNGNFCYNFNDFRVDPNQNVLCIVLPSPTLNNHAPCAKYDAHHACESLVTSLGPTPVGTSAGELLRVIFLAVLSIAGGVAVLLLISAGYKILTSGGKPEAIQAGRDQLSSAIVGLLFIIFAYVTFQFIVVDLLRLPGITK